MFTGIIEETGRVAAIEPLERARRIRVEAGTVLDGLSRGASVAIDGACHTAIEIDTDGFVVESVGTTLSRTVAGSYEVGSVVNLERAAVLGARMDGHLVQGHVDGVGTLLRVERDGEYRLLDFRIPDEVLRQTILHGSIAFNGISLTVNRLLDGGCQVAIIPHTWRETNLSALEPGDPVNVEGDMIGKYVARVFSHDRSE